MPARQERIFVGDFETSVFSGQEITEVWAAACVELGTEDVSIFHSIGELYEYFQSLKCNIVCYFHNLKFDGAFWLSYLLNDLKYEQALVGDWEHPEELRFNQSSKMPNHSFSYSISDMGQWYRITIKTGKKTIELRDSLKLLPFSVKKIGQSFGTKHKKLDMEYRGLRYAGCVITDEEKKYIANDVLVVKEALEIMFNDGHDKLTIGSCCLEEFKRSLRDQLLVDKQQYDKLFPDLYKEHIPSKYGADTIGDYIHKAYRGGWCYLVKGKAQKLFTNGTTADVNSLYTSMMHSDSGNRYPVGMPVFWSGDYIPDEAREQHHFYFVRLRTRFYLKPNKLPFIQIKHTYLYKGTESLESSDVKDKDGNYYAYYTDFSGNTKPAIVEMTMTKIDYILFKEHYDLVDTQILDGCYFYAAPASDLFDPYINKYREIKMNSKGAQREEAKLFLNNLYGKMAASTRSSFKIAYTKEDGTLAFKTIEAYDKKPGYIPIGAAITSYARNFTIRAAQSNYYGPDKPGFIYADTDSIHCDLPPEQINGITVDPRRFCCWKLESCWDKGWFVRQKTYAEHVTHEDCEPIEKPYWNLKCAGMAERCKKLFLASMKEEVDLGETEDYEQEFINKERTIEDFTIGLAVPGKLMPKRIPGGIVLVDSIYEMR